ncbi:ATP-grasp domain-containing protein [Micromonospora sp. CPCC 206061]|uniref:ATP-grasp domain-containing protein n=1 Tax=Micromonospora sp. CPCC 206061 TaxID=3122410 RepID=UPI002FEEBDFE
MLDSDRYAVFADALRRRGVRLRTTAAQFKQAHELPGWYAALAALTPTSVWTVGTGRGEFEMARARLGVGPAVLRDYSKSMKHYWDEAAFIADLADAGRAWQVASRFVELREDALAGGFVLRRFEPFIGAEVRTWWIDGVCRLIGPHPDTPDQKPVDMPDLTGLAPLVAMLGLPFVTVDLAIRSDGVWRVIELGDAQVSDRPATTTPEALITALCTNAP